MAVVAGGFRGDVAADGRIGGARGETGSGGGRFRRRFCLPRRLFPRKRIFSVPAVVAAAVPPRTAACFHASLPKMPFFVVTHNVTDSKFYKENVEAMIGSLPNCDPINEGDEGLHKKDLHQLSVNFPSSANGDVKIGSASPRPMISLSFRAPRQRRPDDLTISARRIFLSARQSRRRRDESSARVGRLTNHPRAPSGRRPLDDSSARARRPLASAGGASSSPSPAAPGRRKA